jgi:hypothetical protein
MVAIETEGSANPLDRIQVGPVPVARLDGVPLASGILEPTTPFSDVGTVLGVTCSILGLDHPEAALRDEAEAVGVVLHGARVGDGRDGAPSQCQGPPLATRKTPGEPGAIAR